MGGDQPTVRAALMTQRGHFDNSNRQDLAQLSRCVDRINNTTEDFGSMWKHSNQVKQSQLFPNNLIRRRA